MKAIGRFTILFIAALLFLSTVSNAFAEEVGKISFVSGSVDILKPGQDSAILVEVNAPVSIGDILRTKNNARAEITFLDDTVVRLAQNTRIEITNYLFDEKGARKEGILNLFRGKMLSIVSRPFKVVPVAAVVGAPDYQVHTPNAVAGVRGTKFFSIYELGITWHYVEKGLIEAFGKGAPDEIVFIKRRNCVRIAPGKPLQGSCIYVPIDAEKHAKDTSKENVVVAAVDVEEGIFTYTPPGASTPPTPSPPAPVAVLGFGPLSEPLPDVVIPPDLPGKLGEFQWDPPKTPQPELEETY